MSTPDEAREELVQELLRGFEAHANGAGSPLLSVYLADRLLAAGYRKLGPVTDVEVEAKVPL